MSPAERLRSLLLPLPDTTEQVEFGNEAWFVDGLMFAALAGSRVTMHLPAAELTAALKSGRARPVVSMGAVGRNGWVELRLDQVTDDELGRLLQVAHDAARHAHHRSRGRRPPRARRIRPSPRR